MVSNWPGGFDAFEEPDQPEEVNLSSAGNSPTGQNHVMHHRDLGDSIEAMQANGILKTHDHDGTDDRYHGPKLAQANTHESPDTDVAANSLHHTLGTGSTQAATGDHTHDYNGASIFNKPYILCTSTTRPAAPYPGLMIYESDTNRMRVWASFGATEPVAGIDSTDSYDYGQLYLDSENRPSLNPADWEQWYSDDPADPDHGAMGVSTVGTLQWHDEGSDSNTCIARRINPADAETLTDDQVIVWQTGDDLIEYELIFTEGATNDKYFRMSADRQSYLRLRVGHDYVKLFYSTTGPSGEVHIGTLSDVNTDLRQTIWMAQLVDRTLTLFRSGEEMGQIKDTKARSSKGADFRGWGDGMVAGDRGLGQTTPASQEWVRIYDYVTYRANNRWNILPVANIPIVRLRQSQKQKFKQYGTLVTWNEEMEDPFDFFDLSNSSVVTVKEPGLYNINVAIQWDPDRVPDIANVILCINGEETSVRTQQFLRGNLFTPAFSQTVHVSGQLRFNTNDQLSVKVSHKVNNSLLESIFSFFGENSKIKSRLDMVFTRV